MVKRRASDLVRLLHGALGAGAGGPLTAYLGQHSQAEQPVTIGELMEKVLYLMSLDQTRILYLRAS